MTIEFDDTLITQNELIDSQHKELIGRIKKFVDSCEKRDSKADAIRMLDVGVDNIITDRPELIRYVMQQDRQRMMQSSEKN